MMDAGEDRSMLPAHIKELKLPPGWKHLQFNPDPDAALLGIGRDAKGRDQYIYSEKFISANQALKFARIREMDKKFDSMLEQTRKDQQSPDKKIAEHAIVAELIFLTGIRPGSDDDTGADKKAFGATTLEVRHFVKTDDGVRLRFTGKKGVDLDLPLNDSDLADKISKRVAEKKDDDKIFNVSDSSLRDYVKRLDPALKTKDIRTTVATRIARDEIKKIPTPKNEKDYKAAVFAVGKAASKVLGNTPSIALAAYVDSSIFLEWKHNIEAYNA